MLLELCFLSLIAFIDLLPHHPKFVNMSPNVIALYVTVKEGGERPMPVALVIEKGSSKVLMSAFGSTNLEDALQKLYEMVARTVSEEIGKDKVFLADVGVAKAANDLRADKQPYERGLRKYGL